MDFSKEIWQSHILMMELTVACNPTHCAPNTQHWTSTSVLAEHHMFDVPECKFMNSSVLRPIITGLIPTNFHFIVCRHVTQTLLPFCAMKNNRPWCVNFFGISTNTLIWKYQKTSDICLFWQELKLETFQCLFAIVTYETISFFVPGQ